MRIPSTKTPLQKSSKRESIKRSVSLSEKPFKSCEVAEILGVVVRLYVGVEIVNYICSTVTLVKIRQCTVLYCTEVLYCTGVLYCTVNYSLSTVTLVKIHHWEHYITLNTPVIHHQPSHKFYFNSLFLYKWTLTTSIEANIYLKTFIQIINPKLFYQNYSVAVRRVGRWWCMSACLHCNKI